MNQYNLCLAKSPEHLSEIRSIRHQVFVQEQGVDESLEWTDEEDSFLHVLATDRQLLGMLSPPIGTGRIRVESGVGTIGRMAVLKDFRGHGVGSAILSRLVEIGKSAGAKTITLSAQLPAIPFYEAHGFIASGEVYIDADIEHRRMTLGD